MHTTLRKLSAAWPLAVFLVLPAPTHAETPVQAWVQTYNGPVNGDDVPSAVTVDSDNNVIVTGSSGGDYATIKYSSQGVPLWTNRYNGTGNGNDAARAVAVDGSNNVIVTGTSASTGGGSDYVTIWYSSAGVPLWTNDFRSYKGVGVNDNGATAVAVDSGNNAIVTGYSTPTGSGADYAYATIKYSSTGAPLWTNYYNGPGTVADKALALAVDSSDNVIVTGYSSLGGLRAYVTIKYSGEGVPQWTNNYQATRSGGADQPTAVAVDGDNNVIVTGSLTVGIGQKYATVKYSSEGALLWTNLFGGSSGIFVSQATAMAVDGSNNIVVTGASSSTSTSGGIVYGTIKYSSEGVPVWANYYDGPGTGSDFATAVAVDGRNNVIVTGRSPGSGSGFDYATVKYSSEGVPVWTTRFNGPANGPDIASAMKVDHRGNVVVTGYSTNNASGYDFATVKYICVPSPVVTALQLTNDTFQLRVDDVLQPGTLVIEASTDLAVWSPVYTNTTPTNVLFYTDPDASDLPTRFYRAFQSP